MRLWPFRSFRAALAARRADPSRPPAAAGRVAFGRLGLLAVGLLAMAPPAPAQDAPTAAEPAASGAPRDALAERRAERGRRRAELAEIESMLEASGAARARIAREVAEIGRDRARLAAALVDAAGRLQAAEGAVATVEERLATARGAEEAIARSLGARRGLIVEILGTLQRMGRRPPPALLVSPADALAAVRASILLGAVLPEMRGEVEALAADLAELARVREAALAERERVRAGLAALVDEKARVAALVEARRARLSESEVLAAEETRRAASLSARAGDLRDLVGRLETEIDAAGRAGEEARARLAALAGRDPARLGPRVAFADLRGQMNPPASGALRRSFGAPDAAGQPSRGVSFVTRPGALVSAPADGWVAYAGPFRSYGRLLILNAGGGYYVLLAGMERIDVSVGQFVLAGEPVAAMGGGANGPGPATTSPSAPSATTAPPSQRQKDPPGAAAPSTVNVGATGDGARGGRTAGTVGGAAASGVATDGRAADGRATEGRAAEGPAAERDGEDALLYVEFRRNGQPIDPAPFWQRRLGARIEPAERGRRPAFAGSRPGGGAFGTGKNETTSNETTSNKTTPNETTPDETAQNELNGEKGRG